MTEQEMQGIIQQARWWLEDRIDPMGVIDVTDGCELVTILRGTGPSRAGHIDWEDFDE